MTMTAYEKALHEAIDSHRLNAHQAELKGWTSDVAMFKARERFAQGMLVSAQMRAASVREVRYA